MTVFSGLSPYYGEMATASFCFSCLTCQLETCCGQCCAALIYIMCFKSPDLLIFLGLFGRLSLAWLRCYFRIPYALA
jgi:hypothetical protein